MGRINAIEQNYSYLSGELGGITSGGSSRRVERTGGEDPQPWGAAAAAVRSRELTPNLGAVGSSYTNGLGHSKHTFNREY